MMGMFFTAGVEMSNLLFKDWNTHSAGAVFLASFITFVLTGLFEGLKVAKTVIASSRNQNPLAYSRMEDESTPQRSGGASTSDLLSSLNIPSDIRLIQRKKRSMFILESLVHTFNFMYGYVLMLVVMTYNVWLVLAVLLGSGIGYFICNPISNHLTSKYAATSPSSGDTAGSCCHQSAGQGQSTINSEGHFFDTASHV